MPSPFDGFDTTDDTEANSQRCSEACWVSFARQISQVAPLAIRVSLILRDTDRLPSDLYVVPMQVSLRDVVAFGLLMGMTITTGDITKLEMTGPSGCIRSSTHPLMGTLIHFSAFATAPRAFYTGLRNGDISRSWLYRLQGVAAVADRPYDEAKRGYYERLGSDWRLNGTNRITNSKSVAMAPEQTEDIPMPITFIDTAGKSHLIPADQCETWVVSDIEASPRLFAEL